jgi:hypothetical protein
MNDIYRGNINYNAVVGSTILLDDFYGNLARFMADIGASSRTFDFAVPGIELSYEQQVSALMALQLNSRYQSVLEAIPQKYTDIFTMHSTAIPQPSYWDQVELFIRPEERMVVLPHEAACFQLLEYICSFHPKDTKGATKNFAVIKNFNPSPSDSWNWVTQVLSYIMRLNRHCAGGLFFVYEQIAPCSTIFENYIDKSSQFDFFDSLTNYRF